MEGCNNGKDTEAINLRPPRAMIPEEVMVPFMVHSKMPPIDDDWFDEAWHGMVPESLGAVRMGLGGFAYHLMEMMPHGGVKTKETLALPSVVLDELRSWNNAQPHRDALKLVACVN